MTRWQSKNIPRQQFVLLLMYTIKLSVYFQILFNTILELFKVFGPDN